MRKHSVYKHLTNPYVRDVFLSYLIKGARRTEPDGYPIIEKWMIAEAPPKELTQWDCRRDVKYPQNTGMSFYCRDENLTPVLNNPQRYVNKLSIYACVIGMDTSPYDNMPLVVQKSQIYNNLAITYYYGSKGLKVVPNVRLGNNKTISSLDAIPSGTLIAVGTNGFVRDYKNRELFHDQMKIVVDVLHPSGIIVYGTVCDYIFQSATKLSIPIYGYDSYMMKRRAKLFAINNIEDGGHEG